MRPGTCTGIDLVIRFSRADDSAASIGPGSVAGINAASQHCPLQYGPACSPGSKERGLCIEGTRHDRPHGAQAHSGRKMLLIEDTDGSEGQSR